MEFLAAMDPRQNLALFIDPVRGNQHGHGLADSFTGRVSEQSFGALVPTGNNSGEVFADDGVLGRIYNRAQEARRVLGKPSFRDVASDRELNSGPVRVTQG